MTVHHSFNEACRKTLTSLRTRLMHGGKGEISRAALVAGNDQSPGENHDHGWNIALVCAFLQPGVSDLNNDS